LQKPGLVVRLLGRPHFNGWCVRATEASGASTSAIIGCFERGKATEHLVAVLKRSADGTLSAKQRLVTDAVLGGAFLWRSPTAGALWLDAAGETLHCRLDLRDDYDDDDDDSLAPTVDIRVNPTPRSLFNAEGWLRHRPWRWLLPCRYDVWTLHSPSVVDGRSAVAHVEYNCGRTFPKNWIWSQAHHSRGRSTMLLVGGDFLPGADDDSDAGDVAKNSKWRSWLAFRPKLPRTWLLAFRSPVVGEINLRTVDRTTAAVESDVDPANGQLRLSLKSPTHLVEVVVSADPASFFPDRLFVPTPDGFRDDPGSTESFDATAQVRVYEPVDHHFQSFRLLETRSFDAAALEFGGAFLSSVPPPRRTSTAESPGAAAAKNESR